VRLAAQENALLAGESQSERRLRRLMRWDTLDNAGGDNAVETTKNHLIAFLSAYRLVDVLSLYEGLPSQPSIRIPKGPRLPTLVGKKVLFLVIIVASSPLING
jgi:hypothetical protein